MATQTIIWTTLPNGMGQGGRPRLSVHVAPRLVPNGAQGTLADFADFVTWPNTALSNWRVVFGNGQTIPANVVTSPAASAARWNDLFASTTLVRGRTFEDFTQRRVRSYPTAEIVDYIRTHYTATAIAHGDDYPSVQDLMPFVGPLRRDFLDAALNQVEIDNGPPAYVIAPGPPRPSYDFAQLVRFHTPPAPVLEGTGPTPPTFDFHEMCSLAQDHTELLRLLGLVIDLELTDPPSVSGITTARVLVDWSPSISGSVDVSPLTQCEVGPGVFRATPLFFGPEVADGYLRLDDTNLYGVAPVDQDGASLMAIDFAATVERSQAMRSVDTPSTFALPALRAEGLALFRKGRAATLRRMRFVRGLTLDGDLTSGTIPGDNLLLFAEDLVQGARVDAQEATVGVWRSLGARTGELRFTASNVTETVSYDEAPTNAAAAGAHDGSSDDLRLGETVVTWNGWSVGAPRPGKFLHAADAQLMDHTSEAPQNGLPLEISYAVLPGSLPRLRFGGRYRFRARAVDLAGNSEELAEPSGAHATAPVLFGRFEPVQSPPVLLRRPLGPGDAVDRVVLRSNYDVAPSPQTAERHVIAPKVSQRMAELHGMFDTNGSPSVVDANAYAAIAAREAMKTSDIVSAQPDPGGNDTFYFDTDAVAAPYLPDPVSSAALLRGLGSGVGSDVQIDFDGVWPDRAGVRLVLREPGPGDGDFYYDAADSRLDVFLAKAERREVRLSAVLDPAALDRFGLWEWISEAGGATAQLRADVEAGRHWMFTPFRLLTLVHAVKQPLAPAELLLGGFGASRNAGETFATLGGVATFSRKSTARVDFEAAWDEYVDDGPGAAAPTRPDPNNAGTWLDRPHRGATALSIPVEEQGQPESLSLVEARPPGPRHEFGDTKHRDVDYLTRAYSRFDDFFRVEGDADFGAANPVVLDGGGVVTGSVRLTSTVSTQDGPRTISYVEGADFTVDSPAGEVTRPNGSLMPDEVVASWVPRPNDRVAGDPVRLAVPASARPDPPRVLYVVPTFAWANVGVWPTRSRTRRGGGLRVYLERPWWSSGGGELLGVVTALNASGQTPLPDDVARVATQWGVDPVHAGTATPDTADPTRFPLRTATAYGVGVPEAQGVMLGVAGHEVGFDTERDLWYCDLELDTGTAWMPFVRLALARYQPSTLGGLELSTVVPADFIQLAADRTAMITPGVRPRQYLVQLSGPGYQASQADPEGLRATVTLQRRVAGLTGPLAWETVGNPVTLKRELLPGPTVVHSARITITTGVMAAGARVVFEEFEIVRRDGSAQEPVKLRRRPVYADAVELS
ncbi:MAG: hypothetical protein IT198_07200 [Acidimicrobiia bacterium]|nr:hypothetical protein [Acidimicrobiia bacterium]